MGKYIRWVEEEKCDNVVGGEEGMGLRRGGLDV